MAAELGNMTSAAKRLHLTQGAVSQHVRALETELGVKLFIRLPQSVKLTDMGELFMPRAKELIQKEKECFEEIASRNGHLCGTLRIGAGCFIETLIGPAIAKFMTLYPDVRISMHYDYAHILNKQLREHDLDIVFSMNDAYEHEGIVSTPCFSFQLYAVMSKKHQMARKKKVTVDDLSKCRIMLPDTGKRELQTVQKYASFDLRRIIDATACECNNANALLNSLELTDAVTFLPREYTINRTNLIAVPIEEFERRVCSNYHLMRDNNTKSSVKALIDIIENTPNNS